MKGKHIAEAVELPQGTLDLLILQTLALAPQHGWAISERVEQVSSEVLRIQQGSIPPCIAWNAADGSPRVGAFPENNRRAKYYELTRTGRRQLEREKDAWLKLTAAMSQVLGMA